MVEARRLLVSGIVQGVGYRWWTARTAKGLGLSGWVRNLHDGRVEILARGSQDALQALEAACQDGPRSAAVSGVEATAWAEFEAEGFETRPTAEGPLPTS